MGGSILVHGGPLKHSPVQSRATADDGYADTLLFQKWIQNVVGSQTAWDGNQALSLSNFVTTDKLFSFSVICEKYNSTYLKERRLNNITMKAIRRG
jgi:hypothetical protein